MMEGSVPVIRQPPPSRGRSDAQSEPPRGAAARSRSRFQEGSMSDRVSAAPPSQFMGPGAELPPSFASPTTPSDPSYRPHSIQRARSDESCDRHRPLSAAGETMSDRSMRSGSSGDSTGKGSFFSKQWFDGFRTILGNKGRWQSLHVKTAITSCEEEEEEEQQQQQQQPRLQPQPQPQPQQHPQAFPYNIDARPSREEIMKGYKELVASDFFASRAITSTRQPPAGVGARRQPASSPTTPSIGTEPAPFPFPVPADLLTGAPQPPVHVHRRSVNIDRPARPTSAIFTPRFALSPRPSLDMGAGRHSMDAYAPPRGIKRAFGARSGLRAELDDGATFDGGDGDGDGDGELDMGRAIKRLRKSASRLSVELSIPRLRRSHDSDKENKPQHGPATAVRKQNRLAKLVIGIKASSAPSPRAEAPPPGRPHPYPYSTPSPAPAPIVARGPASGANAKFQYPLSANSMKPPPHRWSAVPRRMGRHDSPYIMSNIKHGIPTVPELPEHYRKDRKSGDSVRIVRVDDVDMAM